MYKVSHIKVRVYHTTFKDKLNICSDVMCQNRIFMFSRDCDLGMFSMGIHLFCLAVRMKEWGINKTQSLHCLLGWCAHLKLPCCDTAVYLVGTVPVEIGSTAYSRNFRFLTLKVLGNFLLWELYWELLIYIIQYYIYISTCIL